MISILRKILMVQDETIRCPYWIGGKCTAVEYPLNCNYQAGFIQCSKYLEVRVKEIETRDSPQQVNAIIPERMPSEEASGDTHTLLGRVIPKDNLQTSIQSQEEAKRIATGGRK